jgi:hypothetical protein
VSGRELLGALRAARLFASEDETRPHLNCVRLEEVESALRLVATDGHTLWCSEIPAVSASAPGAAWNVPHADTKKIVADAAVYRYADIVLDLERRTINGGETHKQACEHFSPYQGVLPPVLPEAGGGRAIPDLDASYVTRTCEAFRHYGAGLAPPTLDRGTKAQKKESRDARRWYLSPSVTWRSFGDLEPVVFYSPKFPAAFAIVMPRRALGGESIAPFLERVRRGK